MKNIFKFFTIVIIFLAICSTESFARRKRGEHFLKPQIGFWFGVGSPILDTAEEVDTTLCGGAYFRYNMPWRPLKLGADISYQHYRSDGVDELILVPYYANLIYKLPIDMPLNFQVKLGAGFSHVRIKPTNLSQRDPLFMTGFEVSFPAGKLLNIGLRVDYLLIYEEHIDGAQRNGHVINGGITLYFNL
jgi:hypothetical protein